MMNRMSVYLFLLASLFVSASAHGHIKWFVEVDVAEPPRRLGEVLTPMFWGFLVLVSAALFLVFLIDTMWSRRGVFDVVDRLFAHYPDIATTLIRIGTGVFFVALWLIGDVILTPELVSEAKFIGYIHFFTAFFTLFRKTLWLSAAGVAVLYGYGVMEYGIYHMLDYVVFVGVAAFLAITAIGNRTLMRHRLPILIVCTLYSFLWSAIEKFGYPQWFDPFLDQNEFLTMGLPRHVFLMSAAFVEFTLVYVMLTGRNIIVLASLALNLLIVAGTLYFGKVDALGHFLIIVILLLVTIKGPQTYAIIPDKEGRSSAVQGVYKVLGYWVSLIAFFALYYGIHWIVYD